MVDIDPLTLVDQTFLRRFGEVGKDKLLRYLKIFLGYWSNRNIASKAPEGREKRPGTRARART